MRVSGRVSIVSPKARLEVSKRGEGIHWLVNFLIKSVMPEEGWKRINCLVKLQSKGEMSKGGWESVDRLVETHKHLFKLQMSERDRKIGDCSIEVFPKSEA